VQTSSSRVAPGQHDSHTESLPQGRPLSWPLEEQRRVSLSFPTTTADGRSLLGLVDGARLVGDAVFGDPAVRLAGVAPVAAVAGAARHQHLEKTIKVVSPGRGETGKRPCLGRDDDVRPGGPPGDLDAVRQGAARGLGPTRSAVLGDVLEKKATPRGVADENKGDATRTWFLTTVR
jgi:hypothetical protein